MFVTISVGRLSLSFSDFDGGEVENNRLVRGMFDGIVLITRQKSLSSDCSFLFSNLGEANLQRGNDSRFSRPRWSLDQSDIWGFEGNL